MLVCIAPPSGQPRRAVAPMRWARVERALGSRLPRRRAGSGAPGAIALSVGGFASGSGPPPMERSGGAAGSRQAGRFLQNPFCERRSDAELPSGGVRYLGPEGSAQLYGHASRSDPRSREAPYGRVPGRSLALTLTLPRRGARPKRPPISLGRDRRRRDFPPRRRGTRASASLP